MASSVPAQRTVSRRVRNGVPMLGIESSRAGPPYSRRWPEQALAGVPQGDGVVGFGGRPEQLDPLLAAADDQALAKGLGRIEHGQALVEEARRPVELDLGHAVLQRLRFAVARVAARQVGVRDQARRRLAALARVFQPHRHARVVADVAMAVAQRVHRRVAQLAQGVDHALRHLAAGAGVDHHQAGVGLGNEGLSLPAQDVQAGRHGFAAAAHQQQRLVVIRGVHGGAPVSSRHSRAGSV